MMMLRIKVLSATVALSAHVDCFNCGTVSYGTNLYVTAFNELPRYQCPRSVFASHDLVSCISRKPDNETTKSGHDHFKFYLLYILLCMNIIFCFYCDSRDFA